MFCTQREAVQVIVLTRPVWYTWYYPLLSCDMRSISLHQRPPFLFKKKKKGLHSCPNFTKMALVVFFSLPIDNVFAHVQIIQVLSKPIIIPMYHIYISLRTTYFTKFFITSWSDRLWIVGNKSNASDWSRESDRPPLALVTSHLTKLCP